MDNKEAKNNYLPSLLYPFFPPVGELNWIDQSITINDGQIGQISQHLYDEMTGIQLGKKDDPFN